MVESAVVTTRTIDNLFGRKRWTSSAFTGIQIDPDVNEDITQNEHVKGIPNIYIYIYRSLEIDVSRKDQAPATKKETEGLRG